MKIKKHFTASTFIFHHGKVLLCFHNKSKEWFPVGGHVEENETPEETAKREVIEETGLKVNFFNTDDKLNCSDVEELMKPVHIFLENVREGHKHIDFIYYAIAESLKLNPEDGEANELKWFSENEIKSNDNLLDHVQMSALEGLRIFGK